MNLSQVGSDPRTAAIVDSLGVQRFLTGEKLLTNAAVNLFDVPMPAGAMFACLLFWNIEATDNTDAQAFAGCSSISAVNKAGVFTSQVTELAGVQSKSVSGGTLTEAVSVVNGVNKITLVITPASSLTPTTYRVIYTLLNMSHHAVAVL